MYGGDSSLTHSVFRTKAYPALTTHSPQGRNIYESLFEFPFFLWRRVETDEKKNNIILTHPFVLREWRNSDTQKNACMIALSIWSVCDKFHWRLINSTHSSNGAGDIWLGDECVVWLPLCNNNRSQPSTHTHPIDSSLSGRFQRWPLSCSIV